MSDELNNKVVITDGEKFKKIFDISSPRSIQLPDGKLGEERFEEISPGNVIELNNKKYYILSCDLYDYVMHGLERKTQIIYPKESGYIIARMDVSPGKRIGEAGTGSGALTCFFSRAVGPDGRIYTYEYREDFVKLAQKNLRKCGQLDNVVFHNKYVEDGIEQTGLDGFFLDHTRPWEVLGVVRDSLKPAGSLGVLVPTTNQVSNVLESLQEYNFYISEVTEMFKREYKRNPERLRPKDTMVGHTGYLIFSKKLEE